HLVQAHGKVLLLHLPGENALEVLDLPAAAEGADGEVAPGVVGGREEGEPLDVVPVEVGEGDEHGPFLLVAAGDQVLADVADAAAGVQDGHLTGVVADQHAGGVAAEVLEVAVADRDRPPGAVEPGPGSHAVPSLAETGGQPRPVATGRLSTIRSHGRALRLMG